MSKAIVSGPRASFRHRLGALAVSSAVMAVVAGNALAAPFYTVIARGYSGSTTPSVAPDSVTASIGGVSQSLGLNYAGPNPSLNSSGEVAFVSLLRTPATSDNNVVLVKYSGGTNAVVAQRTETPSGFPVAGGATIAPVLGGGAGTFQLNGQAVNIADSGDILFHGVLKVDAASGVVSNANDQAAYVGNTSGITPVYRTDTPISYDTYGTSSTTVVTRSRSLSVAAQGVNVFWAMNASGQKVSIASLITSGTSTNNGIIYNDASGNMTVIAREGEPAPGVAGNLTFASGGSNFSSSAPARHARINDSGTIVFRGTLTAGVGGITVNNDDGIYYGTASNLGRVIAEGTSAGITSVNFGAINGGVSINNNQQIAFSVNLSGTATGAVITTTTGSNFQNNFAVFKSSVSNGVATSSLVARGGSTPVGKDGLPIANTYITRIATESVLINGSNDVLFTAGITNTPSGTAMPTTQNSGLWATKNGSLRLVVRAGDAAPGVTGAMFGAFTDISNNTAAYAFNKNGDIASVMRLVNITGTTPITSGNDEAIYFYSATEDKLFLVAREGDTFTIDGVTRTITGLSFAQSGILSQSTGASGSGTTATIAGTRSSNGEDGFASALNDSGTIVFGLRFTDGTNGVYTWSVPEPSFMGILLPALACLGRRRAVSR